MHPRLVEHGPEQERAAVAHDALARHTENPDHDRGNDIRGVGRTDQTGRESHEIVGVLLVRLPDPELGHIPTMPRAGRPTDRATPCDEFHA